MTKVQFLLLFIVGGMFVGPRVSAQSPYFPETGAEALHQRVLDLKSSLNVLSISLQPGFEDLPALAYFRMGRGAKVTSAYVTNGEGGENDLRSEYPPQLAATRREEAWSAMQALNADAYFLNLPDLPAVANAAELREQWARDSVQYRLMKVISQVRPDIILISRDWQSEGPSIRWTALVEDVVRSVERLRFIVSETQPKELPPFPRWTVSRVLADDGMGKGLAFSTSTQHSKWKKSYQDLGEETAGLYKSLSLQRGQWPTSIPVRYQKIFPKGGRALKTPDEGLPEGVPEALASISQSVNKAVSAASSLPAAQASARSRKALVPVADAVEAIDVRLAFASETPSRERKILLGWKEGLENLRLTLLGVSVGYSMPEKTVTDLQLVYLSVDTVTGISDSGKTEVYFPAVGRGVVLNEELENRLPLNVKERYRLIFQHATPFSSPHWVFGLEDNTLKRPFYFFIIHKAKKREENFVYRVIVPMEYAPRFMPEVLTPIVYAAPDERLVVRLTNNSRDGIRDSLNATDSLVTSTRSGFRLNEKGGTHLDTLLLNWTEELPEGSYVLPVKIGANPVESYVARSFSVAADTKKRIGFVRGVESSATRSTLRRLSMQVTDIDAGKIASQTLSGFDVVVLDRRSMTVQKELAGKREILRRFVESGGHVVILSQDAGVWNSAPLMEGITLERSQSYSAASDFQLDSLNAVFLSPNALTEEDWSNWIYRKAHNMVKLGGVGAFGVLVRDGASKHPFLVTQKHGNGQYTYIELDLEHQLLNIHAGAFRLLANILAR